MRAAPLRKAYWLTTLATILSLLAVGSRLPAAEIFADDFNDGNDDGWTRLDLLDLTGLGSTTFDLGSGTYHIASADPVPPLPSGCNGGGAFWTPSFTDPRYANGTVRATVRFDNDISNALIGVRMSTDGNGYDFAANNAVDRIYIDRLTNFGGLEDGLASVEFPLTAGVDYVIEGTAIGPHFAMKIWRDGDPEPTEPILTAIDETYDNGGLLLATYYCTGFEGQQISAAFDDVSFAVPEPTSGAALLLAVVCAVGISAWRRWEPTEPLRVGRG